MKERYMIVRIVNIITEIKNENYMITEPCYNIIKKDYKIPKTAVEDKNKYREPSHYIVVKYWV